jgi:hypothetical protein
LLQAEKQAYLQHLAEHGIKPPQLPEQAAPAAASPTAAAVAAAAAEPAAGFTGLTSSGSSSSAALTAQLMLIRMQSGEHVFDSPQVRPVSLLTQLFVGSPACCRGSKIVCVFVTAHPLHII